MPYLRLRAHRPGGCFGWACFTLLLRYTAAIYTLAVSKARRWVCWGSSATVRGVVCGAFEFEEYT